MSTDTSDTSARHRAREHDSTRHRCRRPAGRSLRRRVRPRPDAGRRPGLVQARRVLRGTGPGVRRLEPGRHRRPARADREARLHPVAGRGLPLAAPVLRLAAARRRLRHPRLPRGAARVRHRRRLRGAARRGAQARHPGGHRPGDEPHLGHPPVVRGVPAQPRGSLRRLLRLVRRQLRLPGRADHLRRHRDLELDLRPGARPVLLAPVLLPPARPELRQPGRAGRDDRGPAVLAGPGHRRVPAGRGALPVRARGHQLREPRRDPPVPQALPQGDGRRVPGPGAAGRGQPVAQPTWWSTSATRTSAATSARWRSTSR